VFKKTERLTKEKEIKQVFNEGKKVFSRSLILFFLKNDLKTRRATVIVSSKVSKKATERNLYKRRIREVVKNLELIGFDMVIIALKEIKNQNFIGIKKDLENAVGKIK